MSIPHLNPRRIYLIGTGIISHTHAEAASRHLPGAELHVFDRSAETLDSFLKKHPEAVRYDSLETLLSAPAEPSDIVVVATPPFAHLEGGRAALESGRPVLMEKPLATTRDQARELLELAREQGVRLGCCSSRFLGRATYPDAVNLLHDEVIGRLQWVDWRAQWFKGRLGFDQADAPLWRLRKDLAGGGILMDWGSYDFTTLNALLKPSSVTVRAAWSGPTPTARPPHVTFEPDVENQTLAWLDYTLADGSIVPIRFERSEHVHDPRIDGDGRKHEHRFFGKRGAFTWDWFPGNATCLHREENGEYHTEETSSDESFDAVMDYPLATFARAVDGDPESGSCVDAEAVFNFACIQALYEAAESGASVTIQKGDFA